MATLTQRTEIELAAEELLSLHDARGTRLRLLEGSLWLTLDHDPRDVFLGPGDRFAVDRDGLTLLHALAPTRLQVDSAADAAALLPWSGWRRAVAGLARRLLLPAPPSGLAGA